MSVEKKLFTDRRWTDPPAVEVIGSAQSTEEERKAMSERAEAFFKQMGILKENDHIEDFRVD